MDDSAGAAGASAVDRRVDQHGAVRLFDAVSDVERVDVVAQVCVVSVVYKCVDVNCAGGEINRGRARDADFRSDVAE